MFARFFEEGDDPMPHLSRIRSAHAQINASGEENLSDRMLAYAMTLALPESYTTVKQNLWLRSPLTSVEVVGGVQAEWARRKTSHNSGMLIAISIRDPGRVGKREIVRSRQQCLLHRA